MTDTLQYQAVGEIERLTQGAKIKSPKPIRDRWGRFKRDPSAEYDWYYQLEPNEREYISRNHMGGSFGPDDVATLLDTDIDSAMAQWLMAVRAARSKISDPFSDDYDLSCYDDDMLDLVGPDEMAEMLNVKRNTIDQWRKRGLLPATDLVISKTPIWTRQAVLDWAQLTGREVVEPL